MNNKYTIRVTHPLIRPGLTIETEASERYAMQVVEKLMEIVRAINSGKINSTEETAHD